MSNPSPHESPPRGMADAAEHAHEEPQPSLAAGAAEVAVKSTRWGLWAASIGLLFAIMATAWVSSVR